MTGSKDRLVSTRIDQSAGERHPVVPGLVGVRAGSRCWMSESLREAPDQPGKGASQNVAAASETRCRCQPAERRPQGAGFGVEPAKAHVTSPTPSSADNQPDQICRMASGDR